MSLVTASEILRKRERRYVEVEIPTLGTVRLQSLTEKERMQWEIGQYDKRGQVDQAKLQRQRTALIGLCLVDENGHRLLAESDCETMANETDATIVDALFEACKAHLNLLPGTTAGKSEG